MASREEVACPICGEMILAVALKCKHCGEWLNTRNDTDPKSETSIVRQEPTVSEESDLALGNLKEQISPAIGIDAKSVDALQAAGIITRIHVISAMHVNSGLDTRAILMQCHQDDPSLHTMEAQYVTEIDNILHAWAGDYHDLSNEILKTLARHRDATVRRMVAGLVDDQQTLLLLINDEDAEVAYGLNTNNSALMQDPAFKERLINQILTQPIPELPTIGPATLALLRTYRVQCLGDLLRTGAEGLADISGIGQATISVLREWVRSHKRRFMNRHFRDEVQRRKASWKWSI